jgi:1,4-dihydroxy-2-naphthoyl-CoA hydrolase
MTIWFGNPTLTAINRWHDETLPHYLDIVFTEIGADYLKAQMPITARAVQPFRTMHGGASATLAETIGSVAAALTVDGARQRCVGLALNVNHIRPILEGQMAYATVQPQHRGRTTQVWRIEIHDGRGKLASAATLTVAVIDGVAGLTGDDPQQN